VATRLAWAGGEGHHLSEAELHTRVASPAPEADVRALIADAEAECPVCQAISGSMALRVTADVVSG
jgi:organic hydroperoxide reductase OsmC/OhrA